MLFKQRERHADGICTWWSGPVPVGGAVARELLARGQQVRVVTRSGGGVDGAEKVAADASDASRLSELATGAAAIYNCVNPPYTGLAERVAAGGEGTAGRGRIQWRRPRDDEQPVRLRTGRRTDDRVDATGRDRARRAGSATRCGATRWLRTRPAAIRAFEVRGSDYLGGNSLLAMLVTPALRKGRRAFVPADLDVPHTWTNVEDVARLLVVGAVDERAWGQAVARRPARDPCSLRELTAIAAAQLGAKPKVSALPYGVVWAAGLVSPMLRELRETQHQFRAPFVLDSSAAQADLRARADADRGRRSGWTSRPAEPG